jgi:hypothetical protein
MGESTFVQACSPLIEIGDAVKYDNIDTGFKQS